MDFRELTMKDFSIEELKQIKEGIEKELKRRTIKVPDKDDGHNSKDRPS